MSTLIRRKWTRVAFQGGFPVLLRRHVSQAAHGAFFVEELDIVRDRGGDVLGVADAEVDEHLPAWRLDRPSPISRTVPRSLGIRAGGSDVFLL